MPDLFALMPSLEGRHPLLTGRRIALIRELQIGLTQFASLTPPPTPSPEVWPFGGGGEEISETRPSRAKRT